MAKYFDLIIKGNIITVVNEKPRAEAIGIKGEKIVSVGSVKDVEQGAGKSTRVLDFKDKTVLPGFIDSHTHPMGVGRSQLSLDLSSVTSVSEALARIKQRVQITPPGKWVVCGGYNPLCVAGKRFLTLKELDEISTKHPISVTPSGGHCSMLNTASFELLQLTAGMEGVVTDTRGELTGIIQDPASSQTLEIIGALTSDTERLEAITVATQEAASAGITTLFAKEPLESIDFILKNIEHIPVRITPMIMGAVNADLILENAIKCNYLGNKKCVAIVGDGAIEAHTGAMFEPYTNDPGTLGMLMYSDDELYQFVEKAHKAGLQISFHAESDRSIDQILWAYEKVLEKYPRKDHRHRIEHFEVPTKKQINRVARLGVALAMQPMFITVCEGPNLDYYRALLGDERVKRTHPFRSILDEEILVSGGSDAPVTRMNPLGGIQACVTHPTKEQRIDVYEAIELFTINGAKIGFEEELKGSIEAGKLADFVVLSNDPYRVPREKIGDIKVDMTIVGGKVVYERKT